MKDVALRLSSCYLVFSSVSHGSFARSSLAELVFVFRSPPLTDGTEKGQQALYVSGRLRNTRRLEEIKDGA